MKKKDFDLFSQKYKSNCKTKSSDSFVLEIYSIILKEEENGFGYWDEGHAGDELFDKYNSVKCKSHWDALAVDIDNWSNNQLERLVQSLVNYNVGPIYWNGKYETSSINDMEQNTISIEFKLDLLIEIINVSKRRRQLENVKYKSWVFDIMIYEVWFFTGHFDLFIERNPANLNKLIYVADYLELRRHISYDEQKFFLDQIDNALLNQS